MGKYIKHRDKYIVECYFLDHSECDDDVSPSVCECVCYGILYEETEYAYHICSWLTDNDPTSHSKFYCILKSAVLALNKIKKIKYCD
jgi:hypothetical protein